MSHRYHLPPSAHTTFVADRFVVCTFVPRPFETDPGRDQGAVLPQQRRLRRSDLLSRGQFLLARQHPSRHGDAASLRLHARPAPKALANVLQQPKSCHRRSGGDDRRARSARYRRRRAARSNGRATSTAGARTNEACEPASAAAATASSSSSIAPCERCDRGPRDRPDAAGGARSTGAILSRACAPRPRALESQDLRRCAGASIACACAAPLPRAYQWLDGSAYLHHVELVRKARGAQMPASFLTDPLMYQGGSDMLLGACDDVRLRKRGTRHRS